MGQKQARQGLRWDSGLDVILDAVVQGKQDDADRLAHILTVITQHSRVCEVCLKVLKRACIDVWCMLPTVGTSMRHRHGSVGA